MTECLLSETKMSKKVSIIIPSRNETYKTNLGTTVLQQTVSDVLKKATGNFEVLVTFDGKPYQKLPKHPNLRIFANKDPIGSKNCINMMAKEAKGKYLFKLDSHCMLSEGFDEILSADMEDNWVVIPRFYVLNAEEWKWQDQRFYDYFYLPCPLTDKKMFRFQAGGHWRQRTQERLHLPLDENMKLHGSAFFISKDFLLSYLGGLDSSYDDSSGEDIEVSLKTWLGPWGGRLMVNKNCWYAHMHKGRERSRGWRVSSGQISSTYLKIAKYWMKDSWEEQAHPLSWLIERFWPVPTWPEDFRKLWDEWRKKNGKN